MLTTAILFILVLAVLVFVHEFGHFVVAKLTGMRVDEFGIGFPPRMVSFKRGETVYSINWFPIGGFVKIHGENPNDESLTGIDSKRSFTARPRYFQILVLIAGITCNILFAWLLTSIGFLGGLPVSADSYGNQRPLEQLSVTVTQVVPNTPAATAGLKEGDKLELLETKDDAVYPETADEVIQFVEKHGNEMITLHFDRAGNSEVLNITPAKGIVTTDPNQPALGVIIDAVGILKLAPFDAFIEGGRSTYFATILTAKGLAGFIGQTVIGKASFKNVSGPLGIARLVGDARALGFSYFITFVSFISINLAIINLIPFPALDGGRILFVLIESVIRRPIPYKITNIVNSIGFFLLLLLMVVVTFHDVLNLWVK